MLPALVRPRHQVGEHVDQSGSRRCLTREGAALQGDEQSLFERAKKAADELLGTAAYGVAHAEGEATDWGEALVRSDLLEEAALTRAAG